MTDYLVSVAESSNIQGVIFTPTACSLALRKLAVGAELFAICHAEFISASLSESIYINPESRLSDLVVASRGATGDKFRIRDPETILKRVQHRIQGDNIVS